MLGVTLPLGAKNGPARVQHPAATASSAPPKMGALFRATCPKPTTPSLLHLVDNVGPLRIAEPRERINRSGAHGA